jgi:hypothetical protein
VVIGDDKDPDGGYGFEYLSQVIISLQNYIAKDPTTFLSVGEGHTQTYIAMTFNFIEKVLKVNADSPDKLDGVIAMKVLLAMVENLRGKIDEAIPYIIKICMQEIV